MYCTKNQVISWTNNDYKQINNIKEYLTIILQEQLANKTNMSSIKISQ